MIGKFAVALLLLMIFLAPRGFSQTAPPAEQNPAAQASTPQQPASGQEPADEESTSRRRVRSHEYKTWTYNVGAGVNLDGGTTRTFVRGGGVDATIGIARNANKYLGLRADFMFANLPLRQSTLQLAQATGATSYALALTLDPIVNIPVTKLYGGYVLVGPGFYHRAGSLDSDTAVPGSACNPFWSWWGSCANVSIPLNGKFVNSSQNEFGYNFGGGIWRKTPSGVEIYAEYRFLHGAHGGTTTDIRPITIGVRW